MLQYMFVSKLIAYFCGSEWSGVAFLVLENFLLCSTHFCTSTGDHSPVYQLRTMDFFSILETVEV
jgi:hypothetical protein